MATFSTFCRRIATVALREPVRVVALVVALANLAGVVFDPDAAASLTIVLETLAALGAGEALRQFTSPARVPDEGGDSDSA